jgi:DNA-binding NarL/FixJ family response regulator
LISILIVEDHAVLRDAMAFTLDSEPDLRVAAQAGGVAAARALLRDASAAIDVAIIDPRLPDGDGVGLIGPLRASHPAAKALVLTASTDRQLIAHAVEAGAAGVLSKAASMREVVGAVRKLHSGGLLLSPPEVVALLRLASERRERDREAQLALGRLTPREREVLRLLAEGLNDKEIARRLSVGGDTARGYMSGVLEKLGVESRLQALLFAVRHGAVTIEAPPD